MTPNWCREAEMSHQLMAQEDAYGDEISHHLPLHPKGAV